MTNELKKETLLVANVVEKLGYTKSSAAFRAVVEAIKAHEQGKPLPQINGNERADENSQYLKF